MFLLICWPDSLAEHFCMHSYMIIPLNALKNRSHKWEIKWIFVSTLFIRMCLLSVISSALQVSYVSSHKCTDNFDVYPISLSFSLYCIFSHMNIYLLFFLLFVWRTIAFFEDRGSYEKLVHWCLLSVSHYLCCKIDTELMLF